MLWRHRKRNTDLRRKRNRILRTYKQKYLYYLNIIDASDWYVFDINVSSVPVTNVLQEAKCLDS